MATKAYIHETPIAPSGSVQPQPMLVLVHDRDNYTAIERSAPGVASRGVHPGAVGALVGLYAAMLASFWLFFVRDAEIGWIFAMITVLMVMFFALVAGGIVVADSAAPGEPGRSFATFLGGKVETLTETITGAQAAIQMLFLPAAMLVLATATGVIAQFSRMG